MQQENFHWREFALGADRHRLEQWLQTRPFEGLDHVTGAQRNGPAPSAVSSNAPTPRDRPKVVAATAGSVQGSPKPSEGDRAAVPPMEAPRIVEPAT